MFLEVRASGNPPDSTICLKPKEFDFLAQAIVDRKQLRKDTAIYSKIIRAKDIIIVHTNSQLAGCQVSGAAKDSVGATYKRAYIKEEAAKVTAEKKLSRFKNLSLILGSVSVALLAVLVLVL